MAQIIVAEQSLALCSVCPYCSLRTDCTAHEERAGQQVAVMDYRKAPTECPRCGSPMEPGEKAQKFQDAMAAKEANRFGPGVGQIIEVPRARRKGVELEGDDNGEA